MTRSEYGRRRFLGLLLGAPIALAVETHPGLAEKLAAVAGKLAPTPECDDGDDPTPSETAGPFFRTHSPKRTSLLEPGLGGTKVVVAGRVFHQGCKPVAGALVDFWHADDEGEYDNEGFRCRGHQFTDAQGRYRLETVVPGLYPGRTRHFHVKVQAPRGRVLTTQLYFPGEPHNRRDFLYRPELLLAVAGGADARQARFHFLLES
jgi:protocatechuate 3,4-dioxygenase beta subunit